MTDKISKNNFWSLFGKLASILATIWVLTQLYNYYIKTEHKIISKGDHFSFELPPDITGTLSDYVNRIALERAYKKYFNDGSRIDSVNKIDNILKKLKLKYNDNLPEDYYNLSNVKNEYSYYRNSYSNFLYSDYKSSWTFSIINDGNKPLEELILEIPFEGIFVLNSKNDTPKHGTFKNQIELGNLKPKQEIIIKAWVKNQFYDLLDYDEEKTRITHKYGWSSIEYSKKAEGLVLWYQKNEFSGMIVFVTVFIVLIFVFFFGWLYGPKLAENDKRIKLKEFEEMRRLSEEAKENIANSDGLEKPK